MNDVNIPGREDDGNLVKQLLSRYDSPAYVRRARRVQEVIDQLVDRCRQQRDKWLTMVRIRLGMLRALSNEWQGVRPWLAGEEQLLVLHRLQAELKPQLRIPVRSTMSSWRLQHALQGLVKSLELFNRRWQAYLQGVDLAEVNEVREAYNRYYLLEKECALRSVRLARLGFTRLAPFTRDDLIAMLPLLPVPSYHGD
jgi:hypothetical protein